MESTSFFLLLVRIKVNTEWGRFIDPLLVGNFSEGDLNMLGKIDVTKVK